MPDRPGFLSQGHYIHFVEILQFVPFTFAGTVHPGQSSLAHTPCIFPYQGNPENPVSAFPGAYLFQSGTERTSCSVLPSDLHKTSSSSSCYLLCLMFPFHFSHCLLHSESCSCMDFVPHIPGFCQSCHFLHKFVSKLHVLYPISSCTIGLTLCLFFQGIHFAKKHIKEEFLSC